LNKIFINQIQKIRQEIGNRSPKYLRKKNLNKGIGKGVRKLVKLRCGNMEERNKYWLSEENRRCTFWRSRYRLHGTLYRRVSKNK